MPITYNPFLVVISAMIAMSAGYVAIEYVKRVAGSRGSDQKLA